MSIAVEDQVVERSQPIVLRVPIDEEIVIADDVRIPAGIVDLASFREWSLSEDFPARGRIDYSNGTIWVDLSMEQAYTQSRVKVVFSKVLETLLEKNDTGYLFADRMRVALPACDYGIEPDGLFISYESLDSGRVKEIAGTEEGVIEFEGPPDMVLEILSKSSEKKDRTELPDVYRRSQVTEFWRLDARTIPAVLEIFNLDGDHYASAETKNGWQFSSVFDIWFQLTSEFDARGNPRVRLLVKEVIA